MKTLLTLNQTWKQCLSQWEWVMEHLEEFKGIVSEAKEEWMRRYYPNQEVSNDCFFCEYALQHGGHLTKEVKGHEYRSCPKCPGRLVNRKFRCEYISYDWLDHPKFFYKKLLALNAKRLQN